MTGTGNELDAALARLRELVGAPSGDTIGMLSKACEEIEEFRLVVGSRMCGFCGWSIGNDEPQWQERLTEHLLACEKHPLKKACDKIDTLEAEIETMREVCETAMALESGSWSDDRVGDVCDAARRLAAVREGR